MTLDYMDEDDLPSRRCPDVHITKTNVGQIFSSIRVIPQRLQIHEYQSISRSRGNKGRINTK